MQDIDPVIEAIGEWLVSQFPGARIQSRGDFDRDTHLFRVHPATGRPAELELSREVLEHEEPSVLVHHLIEAGVTDRMRRDPDMRVQYFSSGINSFETRFVSCDGRQYRIVREGSHSVAIYDSADARLKNSPPTLTVFNGSIFQRPEKEWCDQIRAWRGSSQ